MLSMLTATLLLVSLSCFVCSFSLSQQAHSKIVMNKILLGIRTKSNESNDRTNHHFGCHIHSGIVTYTCIYTMKLNISECIDFPFRFSWKIVLTKCRSLSIDIHRIVLLTMNSMNLAQVDLVFAPIPTREKKMYQIKTDL